MAISQQQRTELLTLLVGMFDAAPGSDIFDELANGIDNGNTIAQYAANLVESSEFTGIYSRGLTAEEFATSFIANLLGSNVSAETTAEAEAFVAGRLNAGASRDTVIIEALTALSAVAEDDATWGAAVAQLNNKVEVAQYFALNSDFTGLSLSQMQTVLNGVTSDDATVTAKKEAIDAGDLEGVGTSGQTFTLTTGVDTISGTTGNDTILGSDANGATALVLGGLDSIDGGAGIDTLKVADAATATGGNFSFNGASITNVENIEVTTNGSFDVSTNAGLSLTGFTGLTSATLKAAGTDNSLVLASDTTDVNLTVAGTATAGVTGGKAVNVTAGTGAVTVAGDALTEVTVKGGAAGNSVTNTVSGAGSTGTTLTSVTFDGAFGSASGNALTNATLKNITSAGNVNITNASTSPVLNLTLDKVGYTSAGAAQVVTVTDGSTTDNIKTVNVTASSKSNVELNTTAATAVTAAGAGALTLDLDGSANTAVASFDGSAATGDLTLSNVAVATASVKTGSGNDTFTTNATAKQTVETGAGNDTVTLASAVAAGSTINLGAGDDKLLKNGGSVAASTTTATTVIDAGEGVDTLAADLVTAGNAAQFKNFEQLNLDSTTGLDLALLSGNNTLTGLSMSSASTTATYQNVSKSLGLTVDFIGDNSADVNTLQLSDVTGTADAYTITFNADNSAATSAPTAANVQAGTVVTAGVENYTIVSGGSKAWNELTLGGNTSAQTVTVSGASNIDLDFAAGFGSTAAPQTGVTSIDASAATGQVDVNTTNVVAATAGLTVKTGSANDTITLAQKATVDAGAGNDTIILSSAGGSITTGAGTDTVNVSAATAGSTSAPVITTITDFVAGTDTLSFASVGTDAFNATKVDVGSATALFGGTTNALDLAAAAADSTAGSQVTWFQYNGDTYVMQENGADAATTFGTDDVVVKLTGLVDLSTLVTADFTFA